MVLVLLKSVGIGEVYLLSILYGEVKFPVLSLGSVGCRVKKQFKNLYQSGKVYLFLKSSLLLKSFPSKFPIKNLGKNN